MFNAKQKSLFAVPTKKSTTSGNAFTSKGMENTAVTVSGNGAKKFSTTGSSFVDQFGKITNYRSPRTYNEVDTDMRLLWSQNKFMTVALIFYIRMITRVVTFFNGTSTSTTQRGQGLKHEGIFRMIWLHNNAPDTFWKNIALFISVGSWKDVFTMLSYDLQWNGWDGRVLDWNKFGQLIMAGLENPNTSELVKKYLPSIRSRSNCKTLESQANNMIGKWLASGIFGNKSGNKGTYAQYRKLKSSGTAHQWQQVISRGNLVDLDFGSVHGRALAQLVSSKFLDNQGLTGKYEEWIMAQPTAKYTGFVYELLAPVKSGYMNKNLSRHQAMTINKQFDGMIETARNGMTAGQSSLLVVVDTSSSMTSNVPGLDVSAYDVGKSMALYFSQLLTGPFKNHFMQFADNAKLMEWVGETPVEKLQNNRSEAYGGTNFQAVTSEFVRMKRQGVPESDFPRGILCISDGEFNGRINETNVERMKKALAQAGFSKDYLDNFQIVLWDIPNGYYGSRSGTKFETFGNAKNVFYMSGMDGAGIAFLTGVEKDGQIQKTPETAEELFQAAMSQEVMDLIQI